MKKSNLLLNLLLAVLLIGGFTACKEDKKIEEKEGLPVADGFYMTKDGEDPVATAVLIRAFMSCSVDPATRSPDGSHASQRS